MNIALASLRRASAMTVPLALLCLLPAGCTIKEDKEAKGAKNVSIQTPFGGLKVRTQAEPAETGLALYPGARRVAQADDREHSANVSVSLPVVRLKVVAMKFETDDPPEKVLAFYRKELQKHGAVTECRGSASFDRGGQVRCVENKPAGEDETELVAGTEERHRIVVVKRKPGRTEFALVYIHAHEGDESM